MNVTVSDGECAQDVADFNWDDYLEETGAVAVPHHAFKHVGDNLHSCRTPKEPLALLLFEGLSKLKTTINVCEIIL